MPLGFFHSMLLVKCHKIRTSVPPHGYSLALHLLSLSDLGSETRLDGLDGTTGTARVTGNEVQTVLSLVELCVGGTAGLARDVLEDVFPENVLDLLLLETTLDDQSSATVDGTVCTQFGKQVLSDVLLGTLHALADIGNVGKDGLLVTFTETLGRRDLVASGAAGCVVGVLLRQKAEETAQQQVVADGLCSVVLPDTSALVHVARLLLLLGLGLTLAILLIDLEGGNLGSEIILTLLGGLLLLLFLHGEGQSILSSLCGGVGAVGILGLDLLLLLLHGGQIERRLLGGGIASINSRCVGLGGLLGFLGGGHGGYLAVGFDYDSFCVEYDALALFAIGNRGTFLRVRKSISRSE